MKKYLKSFLLVLFALGYFVAAQAQDGAANANTDVMRSNGKIYVVVAVVLTILFGLFAYLIRLDRKISKLEKES